MFNHSGAQDNSFSKTSWLLQSNRCLGALVDEMSHHLMPLNTWVSTPRTLRSETVASSVSLSHLTMSVRPAHSGRHRWPPHFMLEPSRSYSETLCPNQILAGGAIVDGILIPMYTWVLTSRSLTLAPTISLSYRRTRLCRHHEMAPFDLASSI